MRMRRRGIVVAVVLAAAVGWCAAGSPAPAYVRSRDAFRQELARP